MRNLIVNGQERIISTHTLANVVRFKGGRYHCSCDGDVRSLATIKPNKSSITERSSERHVCCLKVNQCLIPTLWLQETSGRAPWVTICLICVQNSSSMYTGQCCWLETRVKSLLTKTPTTARNLAGAPPACRNSLVSGYTKTVYQ